MIRPLLIASLTLLGTVPCAYADEASRLKSAEELLKVMNVEETTLTGVNAMIEVQVQQNPMLLPYRDVFQAWAKSFLNWDALGPQMAELYAAHFTEDELSQITAFYRSPAGQKSLQTLGDLMNQGAEIGRKLAEEHQPELREMIRARAEELEAAGKAGQPGAAPN